MYIHIHIHIYKTTFDKMGMKNLKLRTSLTNGAADWLAAGAYLKSFPLKKGPENPLPSEGPTWGGGANQRAGLQKLVQKLSVSNFGPLLKTVLFIMF